MTATGFAFDNERPAPPGLARAVPPRRPAGDLRRIRWPSSTTAATAGPSCGCPTAGRRCRPRAGRRRSTGADDDGGWTVFTLRGLQPARSGRAGLPRQLLRGRRLSPAGPARACRPRRSGRWRRPGRRDRHFVDAAGCIPRRPAGRGPAADDRRRLGMDRQRLLPYPRLPAAPRARSASTTASSCPARWCCAAAPASPRRPHPRRPTATSSRPARAGPSPACGWPTMLDRSLPGDGRVAFHDLAPSRRASRTRCSPACRSRAEGDPLPLPLRRRAARPCSTRSASCRNTIRPAPRSAILTRPRRRDRRA